MFVRGLAGITTVGVHDWEQRTPRRVVVNIEMAADVARAAASDDIGETVSYSDVSRRILALLAESRTLLLETLAERIAAMVLAEFPVSWLSLELQKPGAVPEAETVGVRIERRRRPAAAG